MKKIKIVILIIAFIFGSLSISYASTVSPLNNAVSDVKVTFSTSGDGDSNSTVVVSPMKEGSIDYISITASIIRKSTSSEVKTWKSVRMDENPYTGKFVFNEDYKLSARGVYYLEVTSVKCYKDGILVDNIGPIQSSPAMF